MFVIPITLFISALYGTFSFKHWFNDYIATPPTCFRNCRNWTREDHLHSTPENKTVMKLPDNIDQLPVKIKKILNISRDLFEISENCDEMIEYNNQIIKKFYVPDYRKVLQRPLHKVPVYYKMKSTIKIQTCSLKQYLFI